MKHYLITVKANMPYPIAKDYRMEASGFGTAISRAIKLFRKEKDHKKINELNIHAIYVSSTKTTNSNTN
jgi:hypothetical protein